MSAGFPGDKSQAFKGSVSSAILVGLQRWCVWLRTKEPYQES
ncbi:mCG17863, isoform CRA_a [Mus musculus]|nr:mCG17863, isoform CRA_a [Mus musculus]EDL33354.1 mCG17863, isoform CRA_a [Mus musculus]EDL33355.1 mCG17863, isoform CRA_a [Mus musculus]EDL33356.1 mCG17863, isoform CRA_a [Mus musculus]